MQDLVCWRCGASLAQVLLPVSRSEQCPSCMADLRVCRLCEFFAPGRSKACRETIVDEVTEKERANFCDYFKPRPGAYDSSGEQRSAQARGALDALFGGDSSAAEVQDDPRKALEDLFKPKQ